jgi:hypothetical protein
LHGYLEIAKWLYGLEDKPNIHAEDDKAFRYVCYNGHLETAKWLYSLGDIDININDEEAFRDACYNGHLETAKWLYSLGDIDININDDEAFSFACYNDNVEVAQWLTTIYENYKIEIEDGEIKDCKIINEFDEMLENKDYDKIIEELKIPIKEFTINKENKCNICYEDNYNFLSSCNHTFCVECFMIWYIGHNKKDCSYCQQKIEIKKCCKLKIINKTKNK